LPQSLGVLECSRTEGSVSRMEANCASIWSEESETIAHLQSMFWSGSNADACLSSPNSSASSCVEPSTSLTALFLPLAENQRCDKEQCQNTGAVRCFDHKSQVLAPITNEVTANKRVCLMDENRKSTDAKRPCTVPPWVSEANMLEFLFHTSTFITSCVVEKEKAVLTLFLGSIFVGIEEKFHCSC
jgi:hypothetical protein